MNNLTTKTFTAVVAAAALSATSPALAGGHYGGSVKDAPAPVAVAHNWSGFHMGLAVGYGIGDTEVTRDLFLAPGFFLEAPLGYDNTEVDNLDPDGVTGTITVGYDRQVADRILIGVFADYTFGDREDSDDYRDPIDPYTPYTVRVSDTWAVGGRIGLIAMPSTMVHVNGGYTRTELEITSPFGHLDEHHDGWFIGTGVVQHMREGLALTFDYRYSDFGSENYFTDTFVDPVDGLCCSETIDIDHSEHAIRVGLSYRFPPLRAAAVHAPLK